MSEQASAIDQEEGLTITLLTSSRSEPRMYHALVWLRTDREVYLLEQQEADLEAKVHAAQEAALPEGNNSLSVRGDPLYPSIRCNLAEPEAIGLARELSPKIGNITVIQRVVVGDGHGATHLEPIPLYG